MRIVFMGTPSFAVPSLQALCASGHTIVRVVTRPDAPKGRGLKLTPSAIKVAAEQQGLPVTDAVKMKDPDLLALLRNDAPDLFVVVAFKILPEEVLAIPRLGSVNLHPSLLPAFRGAAPIPWAIASGASETGITLFRLSAVIDGGAILRQEPLSIGADETAGELTERASHLGATLLRTTVDQMEQGLLTPLVQNDALATPAPKLTKEDGRLNFHLPITTLYNRFRAFTPIPGCFLFSRGKRITVVTARKKNGQGKPGTVLSVSKEGIEVAAEGGSLLLITVKPEGKGTMAAKDFANGLALSEGAPLAD